MLKSFVKIVGHDKLGTLHLHLFWFLIFSHSLVQYVYKNIITHGIIPCAMTVLTIVVLLQL